MKDHILTPVKKAPPMDDGDDPKWDLDFGGEEDEPEYDATCGPYLEEDLDEDQGTDFDFA